MNKSRSIIVVVGLLLFMSGLVVRAQDATTGQQNTVNFFFVACEDRAIVDLTGTMLSGYDVFVQVFSGAGGGGTPLTSVQRANASGDYQRSLVLTYASDQRVGTGQFASARISIARVGNVQNPDFTDTIDDIQDGCAEPGFGASTLGSSPIQLNPPPVVDPRTNQPVNVEAGTILSQGVFTPDGGRQNLVRAVFGENIVQIGPRPSDRPDFLRRSNKPGLIFAECNAYPGSEPGYLVDTDVITVFWSWYAKTPAQVRDHIARAQYAVRVAGQPIPFVQQTPVVRREDGNYYVFYLANLGDGWRPGQYGVEFRLTWSEAITDGYDDFGPGTANELIATNCDFVIDANPWGVAIQQKNPTFPLQSGN